MAKDFSKSFYNSRAWRCCRESYIQNRILADGGVCEKCREMPGYILHHKCTLSPDNINNPDITLNHDNLEYLCKRCHDEKHEKEFRKNPRVYSREPAVFDDRGTLAVMQ